MNIGGTLVTTAVRLVVLVVTLAAISYFIVRPILDTTEKVSAGVGGSVQKTLDEAFNRSSVSVQRQQVITRKVESVSGRKAARLDRCIRRAGADFGRIQRCVSRFSH